MSFMTTFIISPFDITFILQRDKMIVVFSFQPKKNSSLRS